MSILAIAVKNHLARERITIRELLEAAYYKQYGKPIPQGCLDDDVRNWERGVHNLSYLYDFILGVRRVG